MAWQQNLNLNITIVRDEYGYYAECAELPGSQAQGNSMHEVLSNLEVGIVSGLQRQIDNAKNTLTGDEDLSHYQQARDALAGAGFITLKRENGIEVWVRGNAVVNLPIEKTLHPKLSAHIRSYLMQK